MQIQGNTAGAESDILTYTVPKKTARVLKSHPGIELYLPVLDTFSGDGTTTTFSLSKNAVDVPQKDPDVIAYVGGTRQDPSTYTVDYSADTVTFDSAPASGTDNVEVFYIPTEGNSVQIKVYSNEDRSSGSHDRMMNSLDRSLFTTDPLNTSQAPSLDHDQIVIQDMVVAVRVDSSFAYSTDSRIQEELMVLDVPVEEKSWSEVKSREDEIRQSLGN